MKLIIAEKNIAAKRIASILCSKVETLKHENVQYYKIKWNNEECLVIPLRGHIINVDFPEKYKYWLGTDLRKLLNAEIQYKGIEKEIITLLKEKAAFADEVIIATDADREGEAIGFEALYYIRERNPSVIVKRAYFSAITKEDIINAFSNLRKPDENLAESANARREVDLIWGSVLTRFLSLITGRLGKEFLSAGRVQTPTLALIVDREKERRSFKKEKYWVVKALLEKDKIKFEAVHQKKKFKEKKEAEKVVKNAKGKEANVIKVEKSRKVIKRPIPFNTTEFLRAAANIGVNANEAMYIAEQLYMQGFISYPRTDNTAYPKTIKLRKILEKLKSIDEFNKIAKELLAKEKLKPSEGKLTKDHPPIHPVNAANREKLQPKFWKIYELICRRFFATLGDDAKAEIINAKFSINKEVFEAKGMRIISKGFLEYYPYAVVKEVILPELKLKDVVKVLKVFFEEKETQPPSRYSQAKLIKLMESLGLGTKSTRHEILQKLYARKYITGIKSIQPNEIAFGIVDALEKFDVDVVKPEMTSMLEKEMDSIASGKKKKEEVVNESRQLLAKILEKLLQNRSEIGKNLRDALRRDAILMKCPECGGNLIIMQGRNGKRFLGCSNYPKCKVSFALPRNGIISYNGKLCPLCGAPVIKVRNGKRSYAWCLNAECESRKFGEKNGNKNNAK